MKKEEKKKKFYVMFNHMPPFEFLCGNIITNDRNRKQMFVSREAAQDALNKVRQYYSEERIKSAMIVY